MHIVHVITRLLRAGSEENTIETCRWQAAAGYRVTLLHGRESDPSWFRAPPPGVALRELPDLVHPVSPLADARAVSALRKAYRALSPDVIHTHQSKAGILGRLAADAVPRALVVHGIHILNFSSVGRVRAAVYRFAERRAARRTDCFIAVSNAVGDAYVAAGIAPSDRVHCVRSGMDLSRFRNAAPPEDWRALLGIDPGEKKPPVAVMLASLETRKRHAMFLRALAPQAAKLPQMRLLLAGDGPEEPELRAQVAELGLAAQVRFCGHRDDPEALLALADLSVLASVREGLPRVVVQSLATGCPVAASALPGLGEVLRHGANGLVLPSDDLPALAARMISLLRDAPRLRALSKGAAATDVSEWGRDLLGARTTALYHRGLAQADGAAA